VPGSDGLWTLQFETKDWTHSVPSGVRGRSHFPNIHTLPYGYTTHTLKLHAHLIHTDIMQ
jgi:hypothetical protein